MTIINKSFIGARSLELDKGIDDIVYLQILYAKLPTRKHEMVNIF
jgi:hypothetical protein